MNSGSDDLIAVLSEEESLYERLHELARRQRSALLQGATGALLEQTHEMDGLAAEHATLEARRVAAVCSLGDVCDDQSPLQSLLPLLNPEACERVVEIRERLGQSAIQLQLVNRKNAVLVRRALVHTRRRLRTLQGKLPPAYTSDGQLGPSVGGTRTWSA